MLGSHKLCRTIEKMEQQFVETIKIKDGKAQSVAYHQARMERTIRHFFPQLCRTSMPSLKELLNPKEGMELYKARVVYGEHGVETVEYAPYTMRNISSLQVVTDETIEYDFKSTDRSHLNALFAKKGNCDEIVIVKQGLVTDTSFTNLAIYDGNRWITPKHPLLLGTKRARLFEHGIIKEADITLQDLKNAQSIRLFNAMIEFGEMEIPIENLHF